MARLIKFTPNIRLSIRLSGNEDNVLGKFSSCAFLTGIERTLSAALVVRMSAISMLMGQKNVILADNDAECSQ